MKLTYICHSGFIIGTDFYNLIVDYYKDPANVVPAVLQQTEKPLYVLCSHFHADHYNSDILNWRSIRPDIIYIFSHDIRKHKKIIADDIHFLKKGDIYADDLLKIKAFGSTDIGISFLICQDKCKIFHAGDLNNWHWTDESTPEEIRKAEGDYLKELSDLKKETSEIDLVMFPVDPRLGTDYARGAEQFLSVIRVKVFSPMHFWEDYDAANAFAPIAEKCGCRFIAWHRPGETISLSC